jgi:chemotaxis protein methyltransferase CheR
VAVHVSSMTEANSRPELVTPEIGDHEFALFQSMIKREAGIHLASTKKSMLVSRLIRRLNALKIPSFSDYYRYVIQSGSDERTRLLDAICTNETWFFRNPKHFELLRNEVIRSWESDARAGKRSRRARIWSAGCSTGEEPFSLAMVLLDALPNWELEILATDLSTQALDRARTATWPIEKSQDIPAPYLKRFMLRGTRSQEGKMRAGSQVRAVVSFARLNLNDSDWPIDRLPPFDVIFCRNVLMYFEASCRERIVHHLLKYLSRSGRFFVGDAEGLNGFQGLESVMPAVYAFAGSTRPKIGT